LARPRSEDKRKQLLGAAIKVFASNGLSASTASITCAAGVAEGTLFVYFKGKNDLINTLYAEVKQDLAKAMLSDYPAKSSIKKQVKHVWSNYVDWGVDNPKHLDVMHKIKVWEGLPLEVKEATAVNFCQLHTLMQNAKTEGVFQDMPEDFMLAMLTAQAETTMQFVRQHPDKSALYKEKGFEIFWNGVSKKK